MGSELSRTVQLWERLVEGLSGGKCVGDARYVHVSAVPTALAETLAAVIACAGCTPAEVDVVKVSRARPRVSLLRYPGFFTEGFPTLTASWRVDLSTGDTERRSYRADANPPVLHRKEQMLADGDPRRALFAQLTADAEAHGLFTDLTIIGHRDQWDEELRARGLMVQGHALVPRTDEAPVMRHRTAMARRALSTPMQALWRHGYLTAEHTVLDYGCGRGDDLSALHAIGLDASGWDPYFRPDGARVEADVVNLGFVLNVIEDVAERADALTRAYGFARRVLAVSALVGGRTAFERYRLFRDGVLTSRGTFQKYFAHAELGAYITDVLGREPVSVGPGLYFVFRTDEAEQDFLERRQRSGLATAPTPARAHAPPAERTAKPRAARTPSTPRGARVSPLDQHPELVESYWRACLALGRLPRDMEFAGLAELTERVGSPGLVLRRLIERHGEGVYEAARARRKGDLAVFLALELFERRRSSGTLSERTRLDVREFWGSLPKAADDAKALLFSLRAPDTIAAACEASAAAGVGYLVPNDSLHLDARLANDLPPALRVYIGCAGKLYGEAQDADVVKVHIASGKVSLLTYDDYEGAAIPMLIERVKVDLRRQQVHYFQYGEEFAPQPLYLKSRYMHPGLEGYAAQRAFDDRLRALTQFDWSEHGPPLSEVQDALSE
jgi:DNA phosphorothioation-associated putative methyltransferase